MKQRHCHADEGILTIMLRHGLTLPSNAIEWRAKAYIKGALTPLFSRVFLIATDGVVAWFLLGDRETLFFGHLSNFVEEKEERPAATASGESRARKNGKLIIALAQED